MSAAATDLVDGLSSVGSGAVWCHDGAGWKLLAGTPHAPADGSGGWLVADAPGGQVRVALRGDPRQRPVVEVAAAMLGALAERLAAVADARDVRRRLADNERIGGMGSYDWNIATDVNDWSDELYRIYGFEPGAFNASYERFLSLVHPDDRERIKAIHEHAYETGEPYEMEERIVRPDGETRVLWSYGEVIPGEDGRPARMIGVCRDITDRRRAETEARRAGKRFEAIVESAPDAILVVGTDGRIRSANPQAAELVGYATDDLGGMPVEELVPGGLRDRHIEHRADYLAAPSTRPMAAGMDLFARRADGRLVAVDIGLTPIDTDEGVSIAAFVRDATLRRRAEDDRRRVEAAELRRRQALELNDNVVQGLVALLWRLDIGEDDAARTTAEATLGAARRMMADLLEDEEDALAPGALVRQTAAGSVSHGAPDGDVESGLNAAGRAIRVLIADDAGDLRSLLRVRLGRQPGVDVVAEAADGQQAIDLTAEHHPDVVVLDLSMPRVDGLEAAQRIRASHPDTRIVVLSGYPAHSMRMKVLAAGADEYVEKTGDLRPVCAAVTTAPAAGDAE